MNHRSATRALPRDSYFFVLMQTTPTAAATHLLDISGAIASVCVQAASPDDARAKAASYLMDQGWIVRNEGCVLLWPSEPHPLMDTAETELLLEAIERGISAQYSAWRTQDGGIPETRYTPVREQGTLH